MGITLAAAKVKLVADLKKAFSDAYMEQFSPNELTAMVKFDPAIYTSMKINVENFSNTLAISMADAIYDFVKSMQITATVTGTVISPSGPCTGSIPPTSFTII